MSGLLFKPQGGGGSGSGFGGINYIDNPNAAQTTTGWATYADAAGSQPVNGAGGSPVITLTRDTNSLTIGTTSFLITKDAANRQGEGVSYDFAIDPVIQGTPLNISFYCAPSANFVYGSIDGVTQSDITVYIYSVDDNALVGVFPYVITNEGYFTGQFQATQATNYRLILHIGTTNALAWTFAFSEVVVTPSNDIFIQADSDWVSYTPTFTGFGTPSAVEFQYRKNGQDLLIRGKYTSGTGTATEARISLPTGLISGNTSLIPTIQKAGEVINSASDVSQFSYPLIEPSVSYLTFGVQTAASGALSKSNGNASGGVGVNGRTYSFEARIPIQGWTSGYATPGVSAQKVPVRFSAYKNAGSITANTTIPTWTAVSPDSSGAFNATTGEFIVKYPGDYDANFILNTTTTGTWVPDIYVNGTLRLRDSNASAALKSVSGTLYSLSVGDVVTVRSDTSQTVASNNNTTFQLNLRNDPSAFLTIPKVATIKDEKAANTAGGTATSGSYATRTLNTLVDPFGIVSLASNQFTLQPGTYRINASAPGFYVNSFKIKLRNITAGTDTIIGNTGYAGDTDGNNSNTFSSLYGVFSITAATTFEIQQRVTTTRATNGLGNLANFGDVEVYTQVEIQKLL